MCIRDRPSLNTTTSDMPLLPKTEYPTVAQPVAQWQQRGCGWSALDIPYRRTQAVAASHESQRPPEPSAMKTLLIVYHSMTGGTLQMAQAAANGASMETS